MTQIHSEIEINAPKEKVWGILADLSSAERYIANVSKSYYVSEQKEDVGARRVCEFVPMGSVTESVAEWQDGERVTLDIRPGKIGPPFKVANARFAVGQDGDETVVTLTVDYALKFGPLGKLLDALLVRSRMRKAFGDVLLGLKHYSETGEIVSPSVLKRVKSAVGQKLFRRHVPAGSAQ